MKNIFGQAESSNSSSGIVPRVNASRCPQNHPCPSAKICPVGAMTQKGFKAPEIDPDKCIGCGKCTRYCPMGAITAD